MMNTGFSVKKRSFLDPEKTAKMYVNTGTYSASQ